jgi:hydrogenase 3 maturation protease
MSTPSWQSLAIQTLNCLAPTDRISILGIGSELRGDDAVGFVIASQLQSRLSLSTCQIIAAGASPENFTSVVRSYQPALVLLIDAAQLDASPGTIRWLTPQEIAALPATTHALPLNLLTKYLQDALDCQVALIGIQPQQTELQAPLTPSVQRAAVDVVEGIVKMLVSK